MPKSYKFCTVKAAYKGHLDQATMLTLLQKYRRI